MVSLQGVSQGVAPASCIYLPGFDVDDKDQEEVVFNIEGPEPWDDMKNSLLMYGCYKDKNKKQILSVNSTYEFIDQNKTIQVRFEVKPGTYAFVAKYDSVHVDGSPLRFSIGQQALTEPVSQRRSKTIARGLEQVSAQFGAVFNDPEYSDVEIECDGEIFKCHELILSIRSEVFRTMFQVDMAENRTKTATIKGFDPVVVREMLRFIYTGVSNEDVLKEKSRELLHLSEMYRLDVLKNICEDKLCSTLEISNSIEHLVFGDMHQADKLKRMALKMIASNMTTLVNTEEYQDLVKSHPTLVAEIPAVMVEVMTEK